MQGVSNPEMAVLAEAGMGMTGVGCKWWGESGGEPSHL